MHVFALEIINVPTYWICSHTLPSRLGGTTLCVRRRVLWQRVWRGSALPATGAEDACREVFYCGQCRASVRGVLGACYCAGCATALFSLLASKWLYPHSHV